MSASLTAVPRGEAIVEAARALAPSIAAASDGIEASRGLPDELVDALYAAGLFTMLLPATFGGAELDPLTFARAVEELARADASVAWCVGQANGLCLHIACADPAAMRMLFDAGKRVIFANGPGEGNRPGRAVEIEDGYVVSGRWNFASGIGHADWLLAVCQLFDRCGTPLVDHGGKPEQRLMLVPKSSATLHDVWHVSGLRGTGSQSFSCADVYVPRGHVVGYAPAARRERGPLYLFSTSGLFGPAFGSVALGLAHASLASFVEFAAGKVPRGMDRSLRESATVQAAVAVAHAQVGAARRYLHHTLFEVWEQVCGSGELSIEQQIAVRLASTHASQEAACVVDTVYGLAGSNAIFEDRPFERRFRDVHAGTQQLQARRAHYENVGAFLLGLEPNRAFL